MILINRGRILIGPVITDEIPVAPNPPTFIADDIANTLEITGNGNIEIRVLLNPEILNEYGGWGPAPVGVISIGNSAYPLGYIQARIAANGSVPASSIVNSPAFTIASNPPTGDPESIKITIEMSNSSGASSSIPLLKYNKTKAITFDYDDNTITSLDNLSKLNSTTYTDGCGNNIPFRAGVFLNIKATYDDVEIPALDQSSAHARGSITYDEASNLIDQGWDIGNHGYYHIDGGTPQNGNTYTDQQLVTLADEAIFNGTNYKANTLVVPTNYAGFTQAAANLNYIASISQSDDTADGWPQWDNQWNFIRRISVLSAVSNLFWMKRDFSTEWTNGNNVFTGLTDLNNAANPSWYGVGTHTMNSSELTIFNSWIDQIKTIFGDNIIYTSAREFAEYQNLRLNIDKTDTINGNNLEIDLDYSVINGKNRLSWYDLSFIIGGSGTINNITSSDNRFNVTFNPTTRLVNIRYRKTLFEEEIQSTLSTPTFSINSITDNGFTVEITPVSNATSYDIVYSTSSDFSSSTTLNVSILTNSISSLSNSMTYYVRVNAKATGYITSSYATTQNVTTLASSGSVTKSELNAFFTNAFYADNANTQGNVAKTNGVVITGFPDMLTDKVIPYAGQPTPSRGLPSWFEDCVPFKNEKEVHFYGYDSGQGWPAYTNPQEMLFVVRHMPGQSWEASSGDNYIGYSDLNYSGAGQGAIRVFSNSNYVSGVPGPTPFAITLIHLVAHSVSGGNVVYSMWINGNRVANNITAQGYTRSSFTFSVFTNAADHDFFAKFYKQGILSDTDRDIMLAKANTYFNAGALPTKPYAKKVMCNRTGAPNYNTYNCTYEYEGTNPENTSAVQIKWFELENNGGFIQHELPNTGASITYTGTRDIRPEVQVWDNQGNTWRSVNYPGWVAR